MSLDRELTGIVFAINLHPAGGQVVLYKIIIIIMITFLITIISTMTIIVNLHPAVMPYKIIIMITFLTLSSPP